MWLDLKLIKQQSSMDAVLRRYGVQLKRANKDSFQGRCPLPQHTSKESKTSFTANLAKNIWVCHSNSCIAARNGKRGGNVLDFVAWMEGCNIREAGEKLAQWFSINAGEMQKAPRSEPSRSIAEAKEEVTCLSQIKSREDVVNVLDNAVTGLKTLVANENKPLAFQLKGIEYCDYLADRGVGPQTADLFGIGFFPGKGSMQGRVVIPIHNERNELIAYAGRAIDGSEPKYKLPAGFHKSQVLWNLNRLEENLKQVYVVEGFFDAVRLFQFGYPVVALMGCTISDEQVKLLISRFHKVSLLLDGDEAGQRGTKEAVEKLSPYVWVRAFQCPEGKQPDSLSDTELRFIFSGIYTSIDCPTTVS